MVTSAAQVKAVFVIGRPQKITPAQAMSLPIVRHITCPSGGYRQAVMLFAVPPSSSLAAPVSFQELTPFTSPLNHYVYYAHGIVLCNSITESYSSSAITKKQVIINPFASFTPFFRNSVHSASTCKSTRCLLIMLACGLSRLRDGVFGLHTMEKVTYYSALKEGGLY